MSEAEYPRGYLEFVKVNHDILRIHPGDNELLRITFDGQVIAPTMEAASEAGRTFIDALRLNLRQIEERAFRAGCAAFEGKSQWASIDDLWEAYKEGLT